MGGGHDLLFYIFYNLALQLERSDFNSEISLIHLGKFQKKAFAVNFSMLITNQLHVQTKEAVGVMEKKGVF